MPPLYLLDVYDIVITLDIVAVVKTFRFASVFHSKAEKQR